MKRTFITLCLAAAAVMAQAPAPGTAGERAHNQQERIAQGVSSGQLTAGETSRLETREAGISKEIHADKAANGGKLTAGERTQINNQQNNVSKAIYNDKHNANVAHYGNNEIGARRNLQQQRIANGIANGTMKAGQAANIERKESAVNHEIAADRNANGGKLTGAEKAQVNKQQNQMSRQIYKAKHS